MTNRKIAGFTALQYPWSIRPLTDEEKAEENALDPFNVPPTPKGWKMDGWLELFGMLTGTHHYGYDPEKDFRKFQSYSAITFNVALALKKGIDWPSNRSLWDDGAP